MQYSKDEGIVGYAEHVEAHAAQASSQAASNLPPTDMDQPLAASTNVPTELPVMVPAASKALTAASTAPVIFNELAEDATYTLIPDSEESVSDLQATSIAAAQQNMKTEKKVEQNNVLEILGQSTMETHGGHNEFQSVC